MKNGHELTAPPVFPDIFGNRLKRILSTATDATWFTRLTQRMPSRRTLLLNAMAAMGIAALFLAGCYLFLVQLAAHGW